MSIESLFEFSKVLGEIKLNTDTTKILLSIHLCTIIDFQQFLS